MNRKPPRILMVNFHSACNAGDAALLAHSVDVCRQAFPGAEIAVVANYPDEKLFTQRQVEPVASFSHLIQQHAGNAEINKAFDLFLLVLSAWIEPVLPKALDWLLPPGFQPTLSAFRQADLVVACPGNQLFSMGKWGWPLLLSALPIWLAEHFHKPVYIFPQSIGPFTRKWEWSLVKRLYQRARLVFLRDTVSYQIGKQMSLPDERLFLTPDLGFRGWPENADSKEIQRLKTDLAASHGAVGVTVISRMTRTLDPMQMERYYQALSGALDALVRKFGVHIYFFIQVSGPTPAEDDRIPTNQLVKRMHSSSKQISIIQEILSPAQLAAHYSCMDIFVASRLHSAIFALSSRVPSFCIGYLSKTRGVLDSLGLGDWAVELKQIDTPRLTADLEAFWLNRNANREKLAAIIPGAERQTEAITNLVRTDYIQWVGK